MFIYRFKSQLTDMDDAHLAKVLADTVRIYRNGTEFKLVPKALSKEQIGAIKSRWPVEHMSTIAKLAKEVDQSLSPQEKAFEAVRRCLIEQNSTEDWTVQNAVAELAFCLLVGSVPDVKPTGFVKHQNKTYAFKNSERPNKLVVNCDSVGQADFYISTLFNRQLGVACMLGWASAADMRAAKRGNKITNPTDCGWRSMSYWKQLHELKPMAELLRLMGVDSVPEGLVFDFVPDIADLPILPRQNLQDMLKAPHENEVDDFYKVLGIEPPAASKQEELASEPRDSSASAETTLDELQF